MSRLRSKYPHSPAAEDRVEIYAFGPTPEKSIREMLVRIACREEAALTPREAGTLRKYEAGDFRRGPGERYSSDVAAEIMEDAVARYWKLRAENPGKTRDEILDILGAGIEAECAETASRGFFDLDGKRKDLGPDDIKEQSWGTRDIEHLKEKIRNALLRGKPRAK